MCGTCGATYTLAPPPAQVALATADQELRAFIQSYVDDMIMTGGRVIQIGGRMPLDDSAFMQGVAQRVVHGGACVVRANALHLMTFCPRAAPRDSSSFSARSAARTRSTSATREDSRR